jgi:hypothetical protein
MKRFLPALLFASSLQAATYTVTATSLTMHVGDPVPPLIFNVSAYVGSYSSLFNGAPALSTTATSASGAGTYPITIAAGSMSAVNSGDLLAVVNGTLTIIPVDGIGAQLNNDIAYPSGEFSAPMFGIINVKSNLIANLAGDCSTDDTVNLQALLAWGRDVREATVNVTGTTVTASSGISFTGLTGAVQINGIIATISSVTDSTTLTLTRSLGTLVRATLRPGRNVVNTNASTNTVTATTGPTFTGVAVGALILVNGVTYQITSVTDSTDVVVQAYDGGPSLTTQSGANAYVGNPGSAWGRQMLQLYFPAGCYLVTNQLREYGNYFTFLGDGPQKSYIRLAPNSAIGNGRAKAYLLVVASNNVNQNFRELIWNMGFDVGPGNPNIEAVHWLANNMGSLRNVQIWCEDSNCLQALGFEGAYPGPSMIRNVAIYGGQFGIQMNGQAEYHETLENITTEGQTKYAISNGNFHFALRHWLNANPVGAMSSTGAYATAAILDSELIFNGAGTVTGLSNGSGVLYGRNVSCTGYNPCEIDGATGTPVTRSTLAYEFWTGSAQSIFHSGHPPGSLGLPESETPSNPDPCTHSNCDWEQLGSDPSTWAGTIASPTSTSLYLAPGTYNSPTNQAVTVPDSVNYINFNAAQFSLATSSAYLTVNVAGSSTTPLIIDGCIYAGCSINHTGSRTIVVNDSNFTYQSAPGAGNVYMDDVVTGHYPNGAGNGPTFYAGQNIWARDLNIETGSPTDLSYPKFFCNGATMWVLGYKTELDSPSIVEQNGCRAEIFGFFFYQLSIHPVPAGAATINLTNSSLFTTGFIFVNAAGYGAPNWVNETLGNSSYYLATPNVDASQVLNMFYSDGASATWPGILIVRDPRTLIWSVIGLPH